MNRLFEYLKKPPLYERSSSNFWDDEHISKELLNAHLNPDIEAASRKPSFIDQSVAWIETLAPRDSHPKLLDLGCGPGLYTNRLNKLGYEVVGIDFSKRSISYARKNNSDIEYHYQNYLTIDYQNEFDLILLIYCDYGALTSDERVLLLKKVYQALKSGGKFILDVFTPQKYIGRKEESSWYLQKGSGFWKPVTHLCLESHFYYEKNIHLDQYVIIDEAGEIDLYRTWDTVFTKETFLEEVKEVPFANIQFFSNVSGKPYDENSKTLGVVLQK